MTAPDYISPVVGYRVWQWGATELKSLNGIAWHPREAFTAECKTQGCHETPQANCTCGIYASKSFGDYTFSSLKRNGDIEMQDMNELEEYQSRLTQFGADLEAFGVQLEAFGVQLEVFGAGLAVFRAECEAAGIEFPAPDSQLPCV